MLCGRGMRCPFGLGLGSVTSWRSFLSVSPLNDQVEWVEEKRKQRWEGMVTDLVSVMSARLLSLASCDGGESRCRRVVG